MKVTYKGDYALKVILDLASYYPGELVHIEDIAKRQDIPQNYLEQILIMLKKGGFIQSKKGPNGGYCLTRPPKKITLGEVIRFIEGTVYPISCIDPEASQTCAEVNQCVFSDIWREVGDSISSIIDKVDFEQLKEKANKLKQKAAITFHI
jgi:Rrf2 family transcriptional regulator, cysteine metabolism repressor